MTTNARLALAAARPYVSAAANAGGGASAITVLKLVDQALAELRPTEKATPSEPEKPWAPPGGWPPENAV